MSKRNLFEYLEVNHVLELLALAALRCPDHDELPLIQRRDGHLTFWCGCAR
jgi:hypothetical protein